MASTRLEFRILGPLVVRVDGNVVAIGGPKQRALLALLLLSPNRVVSRERLIGELFVEQTVNSADHALRNQVSRLRKVLGPGAVDEPRLAARAPGYLLRVEPGELDLERFERLVAEGPRGTRRRRSRCSRRLACGRRRRSGPAVRSRISSSSRSRASRWSGWRSSGSRRSRSASTPSSRSAGILLSFPSSTLCARSTRSASASGRSSCSRSIGQAARPRGSPSTAPPAGS